MELGKQLSLFETTLTTLQSALSHSALSDVDIPEPSQLSASQPVPTPVPPSDPSLTAEQIAQQATQLSAQFQKIMTALSDTQLNAKAEQQIGTYQTEAHRRLRLIGIEAMRLKTARQPTSISRGRSQLHTHLNQLQQFVQAMRATIADPEG